jgi:hypothetical protein
MQQSKAIIIGSIIIGACIVAYLGYMITHDRAIAEAARQEQQQQFDYEKKAEHNRLMQHTHDLSLHTYELKFGHIEGLRLRAYESGVLAEGVETACKKLSLSPKLCEILEKNRQALFDPEITFTRPSAQ